MSMRCAASALALALLGSCASTAEVVVPAPDAAPALDVVPAPDAAPALDVAPASPAAVSPREIKLDKAVFFDLPDSFVNAIVFSPDDRTMITGDLNGESLLWNRATWDRTVLTPARSSRGETESIPYWGTLALSPDGGLVVQAYGENGDVTGMDLAGEASFAIPYGARVHALAISPDGRTLAVGGLKTSVMIIDLAAKRRIADLPADHDFVSNLVFSRDATTLLANFRRPQHLFMLWDTYTWEPVDSFSLAAGVRAPHDVLFAPDGTSLALANVNDPEIQFLDLSTRRSVKELRDHTRTAYQIAFSPDGSLLASAGDDGTMRLWDLGTNVNVKTIRADHEVQAVSFSPDGAFIAFSVLGEGVQVWAVTR